jgi:predicted Zn finger-like uncharacterized protein
MAHIIHCPACDRRVRVPDELLGTEVRCPSCNGTFEARADGPKPSDAAQEPEGAAISPIEAREEEDYRPWEHGDIRRDWEPHRGNLVMTLGILAVAVFACFGPFSLILGIIAWVMGRKDLKKMADNVMDPAGEGYTRAGWILGIVGTCLGGLATVGCVLYIGLILTMGMVMSKSPPPGPPAAPTVTPAPAPPPSLPQKKAALPRAEPDKPAKDPDEKD